MSRLQKISIVILVALLVGSAFAVQRQAAFVERFTNHGCGYCPPNGEMTNSLAHYYGPEVAVVQLHTSGPTSGDPFYTYNPTEMAARSSHYSLTGVPTSCVDGKKLSAWSTMPTAIAERLAPTRTPAPISFDVTTSGSNVEIDVHTHNSTSGSYKLFAAITQSNNAYSAPNGETIHHNVLRDLLPNTTGQTISLTTVGTQHFSFPFTWDGGTYVTENMKIVVWVQDMTAAVTNYNVVSAFWTWWPQSYKWLYWRGTYKHILTSNSTVTLAGDKLKNVGTSNDTYVVKIQKTQPAAWNSSLTVGGVTHSDSVIVAVNSGDSTNVSIGVTTSGNGVAQIALVIRSVGSGATETIVYSVIQNAILLVDDDAGDGGEVYYQAALDALGEVYYTHNRALGSISASEMNNFELVLWFTGDDYSGIIDNDDLAALQNYMTGGGKLFFSSQDLGYFLNVTHPTVATWYNTYFKATYLADDSDENTIVGNATGPFVGHTYELHAPDGAPFDGAWQSEIAPTGGSQLAFYYEKSGSPGAGVVYDGTYRLVYFAFGWETIGGATNRRDFMEAILQYLRYGVVNVEETELPEKPLLMTVSPNPFNSAVKIDFEIPADREVKLDIFDITGRKVASLIDGELTSGRRTIRWEPGDSPTGVYLVRLNAGDETTTRKVLFAK